MKNWERIRARLARDCGVALTRGGGQAKTGGTWGQGTHRGDMGHTWDTQRDMGTWGQGGHAGGAWDTHWTHRET